MARFDPTAFSLADFYLGDSPDPFTPTDDFVTWRRDTARLSSLYERSLLGAPVPRAMLDLDARPRSVINMASYNYLGLATHPKVVAGAHAALDKYGTGACGSPILSGMTDLHRTLERRLATFLEREAVLLFNSGFGGALGALAGLLRNGDVAALDSRSHMSLLDGAHLSGAQVKTWEHNDPAALDDLLSKAEGHRRVVVLEGIYSMDGDTADLPDLLEVSERHGASVLIDEAHSMLTAGPSGRGITEQFGANRRISLVYGTFSKAFAGLGGFVAGPAATIDYLRLYANPYGFSCALPPSVVGGLLAALDEVEHDPAPRLRLQENAAYFRAGLRSIGLDHGQSTTHVVPIIVGSNRPLLYELGHEMLGRGLYLAPVDYPSVPEDQVRFRASVTAGHSRDDLDAALNILENTVARRLRLAA